MKVMKRDGCLVNFEISRIVKAVDKAFIAVEGVSRKEASLRLGEEVARATAGMEQVSVEEIQDIVVEQLESTGYAEARRPTNITGKPVIWSGCGGESSTRSAGM